MNSTFETFQEWDACTTSALSESSGNEKLHLMHVNIRSLRKHWDELQIYLYDSLSKLDLLLLTEINVDEDTCNTFNLDGFHSYHLCRKGRKGGGILAFVNDSCLSERMEITFNQAELMVLEVSKLETFFKVCVVYRPPDLSTTLFCDEFSKLLDKLNASKNLVLAGDFNLDVLNTSKQGVNDYLDLISGFGLDNVIVDVTREEYLGNKITVSCIDHILVRMTDLTIFGGVIRKKIADHYFTACVAFTENEAAEEQSQNKESVIIDSKKVDNLIAQYDWNSLLCLDHLILYDTMVDVFRNIYDVSKVTIQLQRRRPGNVWINKEIMELCYIKEKLWIRCKQNPRNTLLKSEFRSMRNRVNAKIRLAKRNHYVTQLGNKTGNPKQTWNLVNQLIGKTKKMSIDETIKKNLGGSLDTASLCESFNNNFVKAVHDLRDKMTLQNQMQLTCSMANGCSAYLPAMTEQDLSEILNSMSVKKPPGNDQIRLRDLTANFGHIKNVLLTILNGIFETGEIPPRLKSSIVRPLFKGGNKKDLNNYRPISILPAIAHIMEKFMAKIITSFCDKFSLLSKSQYGFQKNKSTTELLEDFNDVVSKALEDNKIALVLFMDLTKAFDTIDHSNMLKKIETIGFRGPFLRYFSNYFCDRSQAVKIGNVVSNPIQTKYGIPQGSSLAPLLFNIYINDLGKQKLNSLIFQYADDTALVLPHGNYEEAVSLFQDDIDTIIDWFECNKIFLNPQKTKLMCLRNPHKQVTLNKPIFLSKDREKYNSITMAYETNAKYLGLLFDQHMTWEQHMNNVKKRLRVISAYTYRLRYGANIKLRQNVYRALGESILRYGLTVYGSCSAGRIKGINKVIIRILNNIAYGSQYDTLESQKKFEALGILPFEKLFQFVTITKHYYANNDFKKLLNTKPLRHTERYALPRIHTNYGKRMRNYYIPHHFNQLPQELTCLTSITEVKRTIKNWCFENDKQ